ncbi:MAG TPA: CARDB domain-containing protein [Solirubrobacteraceae bacterium]|nr:CARDB domain-containing protein [Solirubrobacteraceae bacterium]
MLVAVLLPAAAVGAPPPCANLEITHYAVTPTEPLAGSPASVSIEVKNSGTCAAGPFIAQFKLSQRSAPAVAESTSGPLTPGSSETLTMAYDFPKAGHFRTIVEIDPAKEVLQASYVKDLASKAVTVIEPAAKLVIKSITLICNDPTNAIVEGRPTLAEVVVENVGNAPAAPFYVQWTPYMFAKSLTQPAPGGLEPGHSETLDLEYTYTTKGRVTSTFSVNGAGKLTPFASGTREFVVEAPLPNLRITGVAQHPQFAKTPSTIEVTIENNGNAAATNFLVEWKPGKGQPALIQEVQEVAEGATVKLTFTNVFPTAAVYEGTILLDPTHKVKELFSTEKTAKTVMSIPEPTVDLTVTEMSVSKPVVQSEQATVVVTVKNLGNTPSPSFVTAWNPDSLGVSGSGSQTVAKETGPLGPGEERPVEFHFTYPKAGLYRSVAEVNPGHAITETNYANNVILEEVKVEPKGIELEFSPAPPAVGIHFASPEFNGTRMFVHEKGTATLTVINKGPIASGAFVVQFQQESVSKSVGKEGFKQLKFIPGLNVNEHVELTFNVNYGKPGNYVAKAVIDPANHIFKTITPEDKDTQEIEVKGKTAKLTVKAKELNIKYRPGNVPTPTIHLPKPLKGNFTEAKQHFEKWTAYMFVYAPHQKCKISSSNITGETITKTVNELAPEEGGGGFCPHEVTWNPKEPEEKPGRSTGARLHTKVELEEEQPLFAVTQPTAVFEREIKASVRVCILFVCKTYTVAETPIWEFAFPGTATIHETRAEYINLTGSPKTVEIKGVGCKDDTSNEEPPEPPFEGGNCFNAVYELSGEHVGPAVVRGNARAAAALAEGGEPEEEPETEQRELEEKEAAEREAAEQEQIENESVENEAEAVRVAEEEAAAAEAAERANAAVAIETGMKTLEEIDKHFEQEAKAAANQAIEEALKEAERLEGGGTSAKSAQRVTRVVR